MRQRFLLILLLSGLFVLPAVAQPVVFINAGSRAYYGRQQELLIDQNGNCRYRLREVNGPVKDSSSFSLTAPQLDSLFRQANTDGFFSLQPKYDGNLADGAGIYISLNSSGRKHSVQVVNTDVPAINRLIKLLNAMLAPRNIIINYGQFITTRPR